MNACADVVLQETGSGFSIDNWSRQIAVACLEADLGPQHMGYGARVLPFCKEAAQVAWLRLRLESGVRGDRPGKQATEQVLVR